MKHLILAVSFLSAIKLASAQDNRELQFVLQKIIRDTSSFFSSYKGKASHVSSHDPQYHSAITIPGTFNNEIVISLTRFFSHYFSTIAEKVSEKKAKKLADDWNQRLKQILDKDYMITENKREDSSGQVIQEYRFTRGNLAISLSYVKFPRGESWGKIKPAFCSYSSSIAISHNLVLTRHKH